jgi:hypothetical protein
MKKMRFHFGGEGPVSDLDFPYCHPLTIDYVQFHKSPAHGFLVLPVGTRNGRSLVRFGFLHWQFGREGKASSFLIIATCFDRSLPW